jgi:hypothetical protein
VPVYEIRTNKDGSEISMSPAADIGSSRIYTHDVYDRPMKIIASFWARNWRAAIAAERAIMGWL